MPSVPPPATPAPKDDVSNESLLFDYPGSDIILRSYDLQDCRVPKLYIVNISPVLRELIPQAVTNTTGADDCEEQESFPIIKLPESGSTLHSLLTFIYPVVPILPSTTESIMRLLAVAQKYQMDSVLTHIRGVISLQDPPFILPDTALHVYFLAQKYELHKEALQAARSTLRLSMTIEDLEEKIDIISGVYLHELWNYHERVRNDLTSSLLEFRKSRAPEIVKGVNCTTPPAPALPGAPSTTPNPIPQWLDEYIESLARAPHLFDLIESENALKRHIKDQPPHSVTCPCVGISSQTIRALWVALTTVVHGTIEKSTLAMSSPFFEDLLSLPQPPDDELVDGLPVVELPEDSSLLKSLVSFLYPINPIIPGSYEKLFALLGACQKYDMASIQSRIRSEIKRETFSALAGAEAFHAYAIASNMALIPEMESTARHTLGYPMTFEFLGEALRSFEGRGLCDLVRYRKRCRDNLVSCLDSFFDVRSRFQTWSGCRQPTPNGPTVNVRGAPTVWLGNLFSRTNVELQNGFTRAISSPSNILEEYITALKNHNVTHNCASCCRVQAMEGKSFCTELEEQLTQALDKVSVSCTEDSQQRRYYQG
ncbi:hypothetical protein EI94DRAFT_1806732 [Lactarius quietus]|nr:hypothetical protein EI94DRAFT_1806732 [Lactarius quietus]